MIDHTCQCPKCQSEAFPSGERQSEGHIAARFGDDHTARFAMATVRLDGQQVACCVEANPGPAGWVVCIRSDGHAVSLVRWEYPGVHRCACGGDYCHEVRYGEVTVTWPSPPRTAVPV